MFTASHVLSTVILAAAGSSDSGGANPGESASPWDAGGVLFWTAIVVGALLVLGLGLFFVLRGNRDAAAAPAPAGATDHGAPAQPLPRDVEHVGAVEGWELAVLVFDHATGAERAFADVREGKGDPPWLHDVAFVTHHGHGRTSVRGTFAGRYVDIMDIARDPGHAALRELIADSVAPGHSALIALGPPAQVATLLHAFEGRGAPPAHHRISADEAAALERAVATEPAATAARRPPS